MNIRIKFIGISISLISICYTQYGLCGNSDLIQGEYLSRQYLECDSNQFKIRKNVLQPNTGDYYFECVEFDLAAENENSRFFIESSKNNSEYISPAGLTNLVNIFTAETPFANHIEHKFGIKSAEESLFGPPPNKDGTEIVNILILDVRDNFSGSGNYVAGYFDQNDQTNSPTSNEMDIIYIDCDPVDITSNNPEEAMYTLAHEYEHLLHYNSDPNEAVGNPWLDEGLADLAPSILGLGHRNYGHFLADTQIGLDEWGANTLPYYSKSALFMQYLYENDELGLPFIQQIFLDAEYNRLESVKYWYATYITEIPFDQFFDQWIVDIILDNYPITDCISGISPQEDITLNLDDEVEINSPTLPAYSSRHIFIPENVQKELLTELNTRETSSLIDLTIKEILENSEEGIWIFPQNNYGNEYMYSFITHDAENQASETTITMDSINSVNQINYDNDEIFAYIDIGNTDGWYGANTFLFESGALLTEVEINVANDSPVTIKIMKGGFTYTPQYFEYICSPIGTGWNKINLTDSEILVDNEIVYVVIEMYDNAIGYSESLIHNGHSYYSLNGNTFSKLENVTFTSGDQLIGNWAVRISFIDSSFIAIQDTLNEIIVHPNPFYTNQYSFVDTYVITDENVPYSVDIYDILGRKVANLYNEYPPIDKYIQLSWNGRDFSGNIVSSGMYLMTHKAGEMIKTEKFLVLH